MLGGFKEKLYEKKTLKHSKNESDYNQVYPLKRKQSIFFNETLLDYLTPLKVWNTEGT